MTKRKHRKFAQLSLGCLVLLGASTLAVTTAEAGDPPVPVVASCTSEPRSEEHTSERQSH